MNPGLYHRNDKRAAILWIMLAIACTVLAHLIGIPVPS